MTPEDAPPSADAATDALPAADAAPTAAAGPAVQLARQRLVRLLDAREWMPGSQLPGERALAKQIGVSRSSLRQALARLEAEGRVHASAQRGWFVRSDMVSEPPSLLKSFSEVARERGLTATARVLSREVRAATYEEAQRLRTAPTSPVLELVRVRGLDDVPVCVDTTVILGTHAGALPSEDLTDKSLFGLLEDGGVRVTRSAYTAHAEAADHRIAELLRISAGSPVLVCDEITHDQNDAPVLIGRAVYRGDAYRFEATLLRGA
ncbi:GntR family transcriptional regulator [Streptomycetaceae bacterium NBC_01309]